MGKGTLASHPTGGSLVFPGQPSLLGKSWASERLSQDTRVCMCLYRCTHSCNMHTHIYTQICTMHVQQDTREQMTSWDPRRKVGY